MLVSIAGAGQVGRSIARELVAGGHEVLLIERDGRAIKKESVVGASWLHADACELASLEGAELDRFDVAIAATGDDKANLVHALLAKTEFGVTRTVARVNHPDNEWLFDEQWGVDAAVSTPRLMAALVEEAVEAGDLVRILTFKESDTHLAEVTLTSDSDVVGQAVKDLQLPERASLVAILRGATPSTPSANERLLAGDKLFFLVAGAAESELDDLIAPTIGVQPGSTSNAGL